MTTLIRITLLYLLGILLGYYFTPLLPPLLITVFLIYFALIVIFALRYPRLFSGLSLGCFLLLGLIRYELFTTRTTDSLARFVSSREVDVIGTVNSEPDQRSNRTILKIKVKEIISNSAFIHSPQSTQLVNRESLIVERQQQVTNHEPRITNYEPQSAIRNPKSEIVNGTLYATVYNCPLNLQYGDLVKLRGALRFPPAGKQFNMRAYLARSGIYTVMKISDPTGEEVKKLGQGEINRFWQAVTAIRRQASGVIDQVLPSLEGSLLKALLLGQRETLPSALYYFFIDAGVVHVMAISGLNVSLIALMIFGLMRYYLLWRHRKLSALLTIPVVISYCFIAGARPSVVRASIMTSAALGATVLDRENSLYNGLALSAFILLLINPCFLFDVGFQLSFIATLAIPLFTPIFDLILKPLITYRRLRLLFAVSLGVWVVLWPVLAFYFGRVNLIGILINPIVVPLVGIISVLGLAILAIVPLSLSLAKLVALPNLLALKALIYTVLLASGPDWANLSLNLSSWPVIFGYYLLLSGIILVHRRYWRKEGN